MAKFVTVKNSSAFEDIKKYVKEKVMTKFYITPRLMTSLLDDFNIKCIFGLEAEDIKIKSRSKIDLMCRTVHNKVFQKDLFRVDAITLNGTFCQLAKSIDDVDVVFGLKEDKWSEMCFETEEI